MHKAIGLAITVLALAAGSSLAQDDKVATAEPTRIRVDRQLQSLGMGLRDGYWSRVEQHFSYSYPRGHEGLRDRIDAKGGSERILDLQFGVERVVERDRRLNVQARWIQVFLDRSGKPGRRSGASEIVMEREGDALKIVDVSGDQFF